MTGRSTDPQCAGLRGAKLIHFTMRDNRHANQKEKSLAYPPNLHTVEPKHQQPWL